MCVHPSSLHLHLQASTPSNQLWSNFLLLAPPQFLYQAPPGAQQLARPDFVNVPQFGHIVIGEAASSVVSEGAIVVIVIGDSHLASHRWGFDAPHCVVESPPDEPSKVWFLVACDKNQPDPQSI